MSISRARLVSLLAVSFLFGAVSAAVYDSYAVDHSRGKRARFSSEQFLEDVSEELELDPLKKGMMEVILDEGTKRLKDTGRKWRSDYHAIRHEMYDQLRAVLSPDQIEKFDAVVARHRKKKQN